MKKWLLAVLCMLFVALPGYGDVVSGLRPLIKEVSQSNGVDPVLMEAIIRLESGNARSHAARIKNNLAGIMGRRGQRSYASKEDCVRHLGSILARYRARGRVTVAQIGRVYCQNRSPWAAHVSSIMRRIRSGQLGDISVYGT